MSALAADMWQPQGIPIQTPGGDQLQPAIVSDGAGGFISAWEDGRDGSSHDIYAQRVDAMGSPVWAANGVAVCTAPFMQSDVRVVGDGAGGAIISWQDMRTSGEGIYVQHLTSAGVPTWRVNGVIAAPLTCLANYYSMVSDGSGGALLTWQKCTPLTTFDIGAQRVNAAGSVRWGANGLAVCNALNNQTSPGIALVDDGSGDCVVGWIDNRSGQPADLNVYAQRIDAAGSTLWTDNGVAVATNVLASAEWPVQVQGDGADGAILAWQDFGIGTFKVWAQKLDALGDTKWFGNGVRVSHALGPQYYPTLASDGAGGVLCTWYDLRSEEDGDLFAQRLSNAGLVQWDSMGVAVCTAPGQQFLPSAFRDDQGGYILAWQDSRADSASDVYVQRLLVSTGEPQWEMDGVAIGAASSYQVFPAAATDQVGGVFVVWQDYRSGSSYDVYATRAPSAPLAVLSDDRPPALLGAVPSVLDRAAAAVQFTAAGMPRGEASLRVMDATGRTVRRESVHVTGTGELSWGWDGRAGSGDTVPAGVYRIALSSAAGERRATVIVLR